MTYLAIDALKASHSRKWLWVPLRRVARIRRRSNVDSDAVMLAVSSDDGVKPRPDDGGRQLPSDATIAGYWLVSPNDLVFNPMWAIGRGVAVSKYSGAVSTAYRVYEPADCMYPRFLHYFMRCEPVIEQYKLVVRGLTTFDRSVTRDDLEGMPVPVPPIQEQRAIADYLDAETARVDALSQLKRRMVALLVQRVAALREALVTETMATSPRLALKYLVREIDERLNALPEPPLLSVSIHFGVVPRSSVTDKLSRAEELSNYKLCRPGDVVINRMRAFQGGIGRSSLDGIVSPDYTVLRPSAAVDSQFLEHTMRSPWFVSEMTARLRGIGSSEQGNVRTPRINFADLGLIRIPTPALDEQVDLNARIDVALARTWQVLDALEGQLTLLEDHRQALITAAVTGQLDIPGVAA